MVFAHAEPLVLLPSESWDMIRKWDLQFCFLISTFFKKKRDFEFSGGFLHMSAF